MSVERFVIFIEFYSKRARGLDASVGFDTAGMRFKKNVRKVRGGEVAIDFTFDIIVRAETPFVQ
jgi:hypothetical protein